MKYLTFITIFSIFSIKLFSQNWQPAGFVSIPGDKPSISVCDINSVYIANGSLNSPKAFRTTNGGTNWLTVPVAGITNEINCIWAINENTVFAGEGYVSGNAKVFKTTNAGVNWTPIFETGNNNGHFTGLAFTKLNGNIFGLAIAERIYRTSNSGNNWIELSAGVVGVSNAHNSLMIVDNNFYGFGLNNGSARIRVTTNNSTSWTTQQINITGNYTSAIAFHSNKLFGVAATSSSLPIIGRTTDGGISWSTINIGSGITGTCYLVWIPATPVIYILGSNGGIKRSTDNGINWSTTPTPGVTNLTHFDFIHSGMVVYGYAVSSNGNVIKLSDTLSVLTGTGNQSNIPDEFKLSQNYPNPFNPVTVINYSVPNSGTVKLTVFDMLGRTVSEPLNEYKSPGKYEISFNGENLSSGVYYYTLESGNFSQTRKMILLK